MIDNDTQEIWSDVEDAQNVPLPFPVNYGAGAQSSVAVQIPSGFDTEINGLDFAVVGLTFTNSPADSLFATVISGGIGAFQVPGVRTANDTEVSTPANPVDEASKFSFGYLFDADMAPPPPNSPNCEMVGISTLCYGEISNSASFQFIDQSASGNPGDFELILECGSGCGNIGFNLGGLSFSADDFDPNNAPPQLTSFSLGDQNQWFHPGTWTFLFTNPSSVPEPSTWSSMLLGFGLVGLSARRRRKRRIQVS